MATGCPCTITTLAAPIGPAGAQGDFGGNSSKWTYSTGGASNGALRLTPGNTLSAITQINVNQTNADTVSMTAWLNTISQNDTIRIWKEGDPSIFATCTVGAISTSVPERVIPVTVVASNGTVINGDSIILSHQEIGPTGAPGAGTNGTSVIEIDFSNTNILQTVAYNQFLVPTTIDANTFSTVDDTLKIEGIILTDINDAARTADYKIEFIEGANTTVLIDTTLAADSIYFLPQLYGVKFEFYLSMASATTLQTYRESSHISNSNNARYTNRNELTILSSTISITSAGPATTFSNAATIKFSGAVDNALDAIKLAYFKITKLVK